MGRGVGDSMRPICRINAANVGAAEVSRPGLSLVGAPAGISFLFTSQSLDRLHARSLQCRPHAGHEADKGENPFEALVSRRKPETRIEHQIDSSLSGLSRIATPGIL